MERLNGKIAMQVSEMMGHSRERTNDRTAGRVKGKWSHCSFRFWFLLFTFSRKMQHSCVSYSLKAPQTLCCYSPKKCIFKRMVIHKILMPDLISFQDINWTGIENLHFLRKSLHLIKVLSVAMAKALPKGATCRTPQEGGIFRFLSHTHFRTPDILI